VFGCLSCCICSMMLHLLFFVLMVMLCCGEERRGGLSLSLVLPCSTCVARKSLVQLAQFWLARALFLPRQQR
jgi:hypothetical protein